MNNQFPETIGDVENDTCTEIEGKSEIEDEIEAIGEVENGACYIKNIYVIRLPWLLR